MLLEWANWPDQQFKRLGMKSRLLIVWEYRAGRRARFELNGVLHSLSVTLIGEDASSPVCAFYVKLDRSAQFPSARDPGFNPEVGVVEWTSALPSPVANQSADPRRTAVFFNSAA
jgi:hypothetical protein